MTDTISRAAAIDAICKEWCYVTYDNCPHIYDGFMCDGCDDVKALESLPSAEPHNKDAISREGLLKSWEELSPRGRTEFDQVIMTIPALPSADAVSRESIMAAKFHPYPFTHITPMDVDAEAYKRGWNDALDAVADNAPSADAVQLKQTDTLIIADALRYLALDTERHLADRTRADALRQQFFKYGASMCKGGDEE